MMVPDRERKTGDVVVPGYDDLDSQGGRTRPDIGAPGAMPTASEALLLLLMHQGLSWSPMSGILVNNLHRLKHHIVVCVRNALETGRAQAGLSDSPDGDQIRAMQRLP